MNSSHNNSGSNQINFGDNDSQQHNLNEYALAYNNVAAVYSQLDNFNYSGYPNQAHQSKSANSTTHNARHNPYSRASTSSNNNNTSASSATASNENTNVAAAILSYSVAAAAANPSNNYSAALYYHPYYSAHHYLHHPNSNWLFFFDFLRFI